MKNLLMVTLLFSVTAVPGKAGAPDSCDTTYTEYKNLGQDQWSSNGYQAFWCRYGQVCAADWENCHVNLHAEAKKPECPEVDPAQDKAMEQMTPEAWKEAAKKGYGGDCKKELEQFKIEKYFLTQGSRAAKQMHDSVIQIKDTKEARKELGKRTQRVFQGYDCKSVGMDHYKCDIDPRLKVIDVIYVYLGTQGKQDVEAVAKGSKKLDKDLKKKFNQDRHFFENGEKVGGGSGAVAAFMQRVAVSAPETVPAAVAPENPAPNGQAGLLNFDFSKGYGAANASKFTIDPKQGLSPRVGCDKVEVPCSEMFAKAVAECTPEEKGKGSGVRYIPHVLNLTRLDQQSAVPSPELQAKEAAVTKSWNGKPLAGTGNPHGLTGPSTADLIKDYNGLPQGSELREKIKKEINDRIDYANANPGSQFPRKDASVQKFAQEQGKTVAAPKTPSPRGGASVSGVNFAGGVREVAIAGQTMKVGDKWYDTGATIKGTKYLSDQGWDERWRGFMAVATNMSKTDGYINVVSPADGRRKMLTHIYARDNNLNVEWTSDRQGSNAMDKVLTVYGAGGANVNLDAMSLTLTKDQYFRVYDPNRGKVFIHYPSQDGRLLSGSWKGEPQVTIDENGDASATGVAATDVVMSLLDGHWTGSVPIQKHVSAHSSEADTTLPDLTKGNSF